MNYKNIKSTIRDRVGIVTLDRPDALNALSDDLMRELTHALTEFETNDKIGAIIITGSSKAFAAGADIKGMIDRTYMDAYLDDFIDAGSDWVTFHIEAAPEPRPLLDRLHDAGRKGGLAIRPGTPVETILPFVDCLDIVVVMTVEPGFGGQSFMPEPLAKIPIIEEAARAMGREIEIEVDGGISLETLPRAAAAGANVFVAGSAIFGAEDVTARVGDFCALLAQCGKERA